MVKGLVILLTVFATVATLNFVFLRLVRTSEVKKQRVRHVFWYVYGVAFLILGIANLTYGESSTLIALFLPGIGLAVLILHYIGKIETKTK